VVGGTANTASGNYATVAGGRQNTASGENAFAAGRRAMAIHSGAFVWSDNQDGDFSSTAGNVFMVRASGGAAINTAPESGVALKVAGKFKSDSVEATTFTVGTLTATTLNGFGTTPLGGIIMWSGSESAVPSGWAICNGQTSNGRTTPDLRGRFILGADGTRPVTTTGGSPTVSLTESQLPSHVHRVTGSTGTTGGHRHTAYTPPNSENNASSQGWPQGGYNAFRASDRTRSYTINFEAVSYEGDHSHTIDFDSARSSGTAQPVSIMPPFYALAFIMRVQ
jgi:microcystin-dependent protein